MLLITPNTPYGITLYLGEDIPQPFMWGVSNGIEAEGRGAHTKGAVG